VPKIFPTYNVTSTVTGRLSAEDMVNVPRDSRARSVVGAPPGWVFAEADGSQQELRWVANEACERTMIRLFKQGRDLHRHTASHSIGKDEELVTKEERQGAKALNFGLLYGQEAEGFRTYAFIEYGVRMSLEEASRQRSVWFNLYSDIDPWHKWSARVVRKQGYIDSCLGRRRRLPAVYAKDEYIRSEAIRQAINFTIQSPASDHILLSLIYLDGLSLNDDDFKVVGFNHDAVHLWIRESAVDRIAPLAAYAIEQYVPKLVFPQIFNLNLNVPMVAEVKVGPSWGEAKELELARPWVQEDEQVQVSSQFTTDPHPDWPDSAIWTALLQTAQQEKPSLLLQLYHLRKRGAVLNRTVNHAPTEPLQLWCRTGPDLFQHESAFIIARKLLLAGRKEDLEWLMLTAWLIG